MGWRNARALGIFAGAFLCFTALGYAFRPQLAPLVNGVMTVRAGAGLINLLSPSEQVRASGDRITSGAGAIRVAQGCEGLDVVLLFVAALLAVPLGHRRKALGLVAGALLLYALNLLRVAGLWFCLRHWPSHFEVMHVVVGQTVMIVLAVLVFAVVVLPRSRVVRAAHP